MSSLALYRRYRPETFAEVIGQEHVTDPLQQALRNNRVNHAYLFSGPRGCGKTTSARILARCLNCEEGPTPTPCGTCQSCVDLARNGRGSIDVIEIDAASHGGVDDARELREKAFFGPAGSRYKIYIIDEAHMVTSAGFNALLKVVEEPPEHLKFIFATTEPEKVIGTIRSRTHHYPFRLVPPGTLREYLAEVCGREDIPVEDGVLPLVVRAGAGSVRDSMSVMDQLLAGAGADGVTYAMATALLGYTDGSLLDAVVEAFAAGDGAAAFEVVDRVIEGGNDPRRFVADLLERLRDLVILAAVPDAGEKGLIDAPADVVERMSAQASVFGAAELSRAADLVNTGLTEMRGATSPRLQLELICARVLLPAAYDDERSLQARLDRLERGVGAMAPGGGMSGAPAGGGLGAGAPVVSTGGGPAAGYVPGPEAHPVAAPAGPSGPAAARAAVRGATGGGGTPPAQAPQAAPAQAAAPPVAPTAPDSAPPAAGPPASGGEHHRADTAGPSGAPARPGAWPGSGGPGAGHGGRQPGGWPSAVAPGQGGQGAPPAPPAPSAPAGPPAAAPAPVQQQPPAGAVPGAAQGAAQVRQMWPDILDAVKGRRRFTWILLSQNAQVSGFDGTTLQIGFPNAGARDSFANGGSEDVLKDVLAERFQVQWRVEAIVDPSGGANPPAGGAPRGGGGGGFGGGAPAAPQQSVPQPPPQSAPAAPEGPGGQHGPGAQGGQSGGSGGGGQGARMAREAVAPSASAGAARSGPAPEPSYTPEPPPVSIEYDMPAEDDPDLVDTALSGHDLIVRELGATVVEEFNNE
ncbi:DNA polymerase III subunit gamma and tau [Streptomyces chattanoogensis]|uniref:DNA polymerase III subunit gamma/tau n=1 Tax=Streptomyces chattanoogensis TaxID=66876 RepID=A0A0N0GXK9_9ACTN|nr:DNA polymerase III subunit gamma and tau [Streptomyces chattanoogensis]KPC61141.1 DNA polymerase III subunit gamma/tau [Streptomyces chattanoogensis]